MRNFMHERKLIILSKYEGLQIKTKQIKTIELSKKFKMHH